jgi:hypothetical protein
MGCDVRKASSAKACCTESVYTLVSICSEKIYLETCDVQQTVPKHSNLCIVSGKILQVFVIERTRVQVVNSKPAYPSCETLVKPQLAPPVHGDKITEPLVSKLVSDNICYSITVAVC